MRVRSSAASAGSCRQRSEPVAEPGYAGRERRVVRDVSELERKNLVLGLWLFGFFLVVLALTAIVAIVVVYG